MTLKEAKASKKPAIFMRKYDTRRLYFDGKNFYPIYSYTLTVVAGGMYIENITALKGDVAFLDLPADGWRHGFGDLKVEII